MHPLLCIICQKLPLTCKRGGEAIHMGRNLFHLYAFVKLFSHQTRILHIYPQPALSVDIWLAARCNQGEATGELPATSATLVGQPSVGLVCFFSCTPNSKWIWTSFYRQLGYTLFFDGQWPRWRIHLQTVCWRRMEKMMLLSIVRMLGEVYSAIKTGLSFLKTVKI